MSEDPPPSGPPPGPAQPAAERGPDSVCPVCGEPPVQEKCKVVCRSQRCTYRIILTCAEF